MKKVSFLFIFIFNCFLAGQAQTPKVYTETISKKISFNMIYVEGGEFMMGSEKIGSDEKPVHRVELEGFYAAEFEITQELWEAVMGKNPSYNQKCPKCPVEQVSWNDMQAFIQKLNEKTGNNYFLPSEAQWEYAARGGRYSKGYKYSGSNNIDEVAQCGRDAGESGYGKKGTTSAVGLKKPNELGLYDMSGNVHEWCQDYYEASFYFTPEASLKNPVNNRTENKYKTLRGGSWFSNTISSTFRFNDFPDSDSYMYGGRLFSSVVRDK